MQAVTVSVQVHVGNQLDLKKLGRKDLALGFILKFD